MSDRDLLNCIVTPDPPSPQQVLRDSVAEKQFELVKRIATRVGVSPCPDDGAVRALVFVFPDGTRYDLGEIADGLLDRLDAAVEVSP